MNNETQTECTHCKSTPCRCAERRAEIEQRKALLEKREHHKSQLPLEDMAERDRVAKQNRDRLTSLMLKHKLFIPYRDFDKWRPTVETTGEVAGFWHLGTMRCIASDGLQAWFLLPTGEAWIGHIGNFKWDIPVISMVPYITEFGEQKFFKSVKDSGTPPAYFGLPKPVKVRKAKPKIPLAKKKRLSPAERLLIQLQARTAPGK